MLTVACVLKSGGIYDRTWVDRLQRGVVQHMNAEHRFVCLTDTLSDDVMFEQSAGTGLAWQRLRHGWPGWWSKMELFRLDGPVLYLDLDVVITGSLDELIAADCQPFDPAAFAISEQLGKTNLLVAPRDFMNKRELNSSVLFFNDCGYLYDQFAEDPDRHMSRFRGDQNFITDRCWDALTFPPGWCVSYRRDCRTKLGVGQLPKGARVVCFHGAPKPPDVDDPWVKEYWAA
ncbi:hypothetical protein LCGC14_1417100 [marine sediment metagenome]|uniref:Glycosyltransferase n=1 Tax=marine sediment metagenome TaxID=412755 RepID=A0A0F9M825_9ZZZZ